MESAEAKPITSSVDSPGDKPSDFETPIRRNGRWYSVRGFVLYPWRVKKLVALVNGGRLTYREIAYELGTEEPVIREAVHRLRKWGIIEEHRRKPYSVWEEQFLVRQAQKQVDYRVLAACLNRSYGAVKVKIRRMGIRQRRLRGAWTSDEVELLRRYYDADEVGLAHLAKRLKRGLEKIRSKAQELGLIRREARNARIKATKWRQYEVAAFTALFLQWRVTQGITEYAYNYWLKDGRQLDGWFLNHEVLYVVEVRTSPHNLPAIDAELNDKAQSLLKELDVPGPKRIIPVLVRRGQQTGRIPGGMLVYSFAELGLPRFNGSANWIERKASS